MNIVLGLKAKLPNTWHPLSLTINPEKDALPEKDDRISVLVLQSNAELNEAIVFGSPELKELQVMPCFPLTPFELCLDNST